jgi:dTMP kinase
MNLEKYLGQKARNRQRKKRRKLLIAFEGIDKAGKKTQTKILAERFKKRGYKTEIITFPDYHTPIGREIKRFLSGKRDFSPEVRQLLFAANRWENRDKISSWLNEGKIVIADRYVASGLAYGLANDLGLEWALGLEKGLPEADKIFVIDIPVEVAFLRGKNKRDIYEKNRKFLIKVRDIYLKLAKQFKWYVIDGNRPINEVSEEIWLKVGENLKAKLF